MSRQNYLEEERLVLEKKENKFDFLPENQLVHSLSPSFNQRCLKTTLKIAKLHSKKMLTQHLEKRLKEERALADFYHHS